MKGKCLSTKILYDKSFSYRIHSYINLLYVPYCIIDSLKHKINFNNQILVCLGIRSGIKG